MILYHYEDSEILLGHMLDSDTTGLDFPLHIHDNYELYCFVSGDAHYTVEGRTRKLEYGSVVLIKPGETHRIILDSSKSYERYTLNFSAEAIPKELSGLLDLFLNCKVGEKTFFSIKDFGDITPIDFFRTVCSGETDDIKLRIRSLLPAFLTVIDDSCKKSDTVAPPRSDGVKMVDWINKHLFESISLNDVARRFNRSVSQTERIFKSATGTSVGKYCRTKRLLAARQMIISGATAEDACFKCGFGDYSTFFRLFKKQFGCSPSNADNIQIQSTETF